MNLHTLQRAVGMEPFMELSGLRDAPEAVASGRDSRFRRRLADVLAGHAKLRSGAGGVEIRDYQLSLLRLGRDENSLVRRALELVEPRPACWKAGSAVKELNSDWVACGHWGQHDQRPFFAQPAANDGWQPVASDAVKLTVMLPARRQRAISGEGGGRAATSPGEA
jgi:hypothetical protein